MANITQKLKEVLRAVTPPIVWKLTRAGYRCFYPEPEISEDPRVGVLREEHQRRNRDMPLNVILLRDGIRINAHPDSVAGFECFSYGIPDMVKEMDCFLEEAIGCSRFLDIGALHGVFSLAFALTHPDGKCLAIDASPLAFSKLLYNIHKNKSVSIDTIECAVSDNEGQLSMHFEWEHAISAGTVASTSVSVPMMTGDMICNETKFSPDLVKIDVEGHEVHVLRGLLTTLKTHKPKIFLEIHPGRIREERMSLSNIRDMLEPVGYSVRRVDGRNIEWHEVEAFTNDTRIVLSVQPIPEGSAR